MPVISPQDVKKYLEDYGLTPTKEEISSLGGLTSGYGGEEAIAQYALAKKQQLERQANDPLNKVLAAQQSFTAAQDAYAKGDFESADKLFEELRGVMSEAPKLFGNLTPEQVDQYIAPLKQQFMEADAATQTGAGARGLAGSNIEANARAGEATKFKQGLLSTGLTVGMTQQQKKEEIMQNEIARRSGVGVSRVGAAATGLGLQGQSAGQLSGQAQADQALLSSLPAYLRAQVLQELAVRKSMEEFNSGSFVRKFNDITGMVNTGLNTATNVVNFVGSKGATTSSNPFASKGAGTPAASNSNLQIAPDFASA